MKVKARILMIAGQYYPGLAGSAIVTRLIANGLSKIGYEVTVAVDISSKKALSSLNEPYKTIYLNGYKAFVKGSAGFKDPVEDLYRHINENEYDLIHSFSYYSTFFLSQIYSCIGVPVFFTFWSAPEPNKRALGFYSNSSLDLSFAKFIIKSKCYKEMILGSKSNYDSAISLGADQKSTKYTLHGIDVQSFTDIANNIEKSAMSKYYDLKSLDKKKVIGLPGRIVERKGLLEAVKCLPYVVDKYPIKLLLTGENHSDRDFVNRLNNLAFSLGVGNNLVYSKKKIEHNEMPGYYSLCDLVIIPSHFEGLGLTAIEAMLTSRPVILSNVNGLNEIGVDGVNCLMIPPHNHNELARAILKLLDDDQLSKTLISNAQKMVEKFDVKNFISYIDERYLGYLKS